MDDSDLAVCLTDPEHDLFFLTARRGAQVDRVDPSGHEALPGQVGDVDEIGRSGQPPVLRRIQVVKYGPETGSRTRHPHEGPGLPDPGAATEGKVRLEAAILAHGGEAFLKLKSFVLKGKGDVTPPGAGSSLPLDTVTLSVAVPGRVRLDVSTPFGPITPRMAPGGILKVRPS